MDNTTMDFSRTVELLKEGFTLENQSFKDMIDASCLLVRNRRTVAWSLIFDATCTLTDKDSINEFIKVSEYLEICDILCDNTIFQNCLEKDNYEFVDALLNTNKYKFIVSGNIVRKAVYANKLKIAEVLINHGYATPKSISMYNISNHLGWDSERIRFLTDHGTKIEINFKELTALDIISKSKENYCIFTKEAMLSIIRLNVGTKMSHPLLEPGAYLVYNKESKSIYFVEDCKLMHSHLANNSYISINEKIADKKFDSGWYIIEEV